MHMRLQIAGFDRDIWLLLGEMFSRRMVMSFLEVVRPIYLSIIGFSPISIGLITTIGTVVSALDSLVFGSLSDRYGRKPFILFGSLCSVLRLLLYALSRDFWVLIVAQGIGSLGEGVGAGQPIVSGYIADKSEIRDRTKVFSALAVSSAISATIGSLMAMFPAYFQAIWFLSELDAYALLFWLGVALNGLAVFFAFALRDTRRNRKDYEGSPEDTKLPMKEVGKFTIVRVTDGMGMSLVSSLLPLYFYLQFGSDSEDLAPIYALTRFLAIPVYLFVPLIAERLGNVKGLVISRLVTGLTIAVFATIKDFPVASTLFVTYRLLLEFSMPMRQSFSTEIVKSHQTGTVLGISNSARALMQSIAPAIAGYLFEAASFSTPLFLGATLISTNGIQYHLFYRDHLKNDKPPKGLQ